ncbi:MAG: energy-coupling factor transporter ATPase [Clostridia bacterium]|nr:energy-coupling factor transporter ATPase [Clostridia bacterium]
MPISVKDLTYTYSPGTPFETQALRGITLTIEDGEFVGIIGHTGSGKSTFVQHLNALIKPTSGQVLVDGEDINENKQKAALRQRVGLVFQYPEHQLFEETVLKDVCFGPRNMGLSEEEIHENAHKALQTVGIKQEDWDKSPFELSGGQKRRVAIAGVMAMRPKVLILDEPAAGLDPRGRQEIFDIVSAIHARGTTVLMVSHSMDDVARLCERVIVLESGQVALDGSCAQVFSQVERLESMGLRLPQAALLRNRLNRQGFHLPDSIYTIEALSKALTEKLNKR